MNDALCDNAELLAVMSSIHIIILQLLIFVVLTTAKSSQYFHGMGYLDFYSLYRRPI